MKKYLLIISLLVAASGLRAEITDGPLHTLLWNRVEAIRTVDSFAIGTSFDAISVHRWSDSVEAFVTDHILPVDYEPTALKRQDSLLLVKTADFRLVAYRVAALPELETAWTADPGIPFGDFALEGNGLFVTSWFDGLWGFDVAVDGSLTPRDSSMVGVLLSQVESGGNSLYVLDEYNGIMRYDRSGGETGAFLDYLYVPREVARFVRSGSLAVMAPRSGGLMLGEFGQEGALIVASADSMDTAQSLYVTDDLYVAVTPRQIITVNRSDNSVRETLNVAGIETKGDTLTLGGEIHLLLPQENGGFTVFNLHDLGASGAAAYRAGPIKDVMVRDGHLITGGGANPLDVYTFDSVVTPALAYTMYPGLIGAQALVNNGDSLFVYYAGLNKVALVLNAFEADSFFIERSFHLSDTLASNLYYLPRVNDTLRGILAMGEQRLQLYTINDSSEITPHNPWSVIGGISSSAVYDSLVFVGTMKKQLWAYRITSDLQRELIGSADFSDIPLAMTWVNQRLVVFLRQTMVVYSAGEDGLEQEAVANLPVSVFDFAYANGKLYGVGPEGVAVLDITSSIPELLEWGGLSGTIIAVENNILATSDGGAVQIYRLESEEEPVPEPVLPDRYTLYQNYPNPFNAGTVIRFDLPVAARAEITIYNTLGQEVRKLFDAERPAGSYEIEWDGTNSAGRAVASGVYLYRFRAGGAEESRKMVILK